MNKLNPIGGGLKVINSTAPTILYHGPRNTAKTYSLMMKMRICADRYPGIRIVLLRKTRHALTDSIMTTFETILPDGHYLKGSQERSSRHSYKFKNGSEIILGGLDEADKWRSSEPDIICIHEAAVGIEEQDYNVLCGGLFRHNKAPFSQIIIECNPSYPTHWIWEKAQSGGFSEVIQATHADNPYITPEWWEMARQWTGYTKLRDLDGIWCSADGLVYPNYDRCVKDFDTQKIEGESRGAMDWGFHPDPYACLVGCLTEDDVLYLWYERYVTGLLLKDHARVIPTALYYADPSQPAAIYEMQASGHTVYKAKVKDIQLGILAVKSRMERGKLVIHPSLKALLAELSQYQYDTKRPDLPTKHNDHLCDCLRYLVSSIDIRAIANE
jgi:phage terminase large subunit